MKKTVLRYWWLIMGLAIMGAVLWRAGVASLDPDFGWHLKVGEMLNSRGIPKSDPFSYTMPSFPWVDHGRLSDAAIAGLYPVIGMEGLATIAVVIVIAALLIAVPKRNWATAVVPFLLGAGTLITRFGVRPQVEDWLFAAVALRLTWDDNLWARWKWAIPGLFLVWANFHGGFLVGLGIIFFRIAGEMWEKKQVNPREAAIWLFSAGATLVNPYGAGLWGEIWLTVSDMNLRTAIVEWQPFYTKVELGMWLLTALLFAFLKVVPQTMKKWQILLVLTMLLGAMSSLRNSPFYVLTAIPATAALIGKAYEMVKPKAEMRDRAKKFYAVVLAIAITIFAVRVTTTVWKTFSDGGDGLVYPDKAVAYLKAHPIKGRLFSEYAYGGYLIWMLPEEKVFIDGRMPSWRWRAPAGESNWAFKDYEKVAGGEDFSEIFKKYGVGTVLWPVGTINGAGIEELTNISKTWWGKWLVDGEALKKMKTFPQRLTEAGWQKEYEDNTAAIYVSP
jgi:hypothetical protein